MKICVRSVGVLDHRIARADRSAWGITVVLAQEVRMLQSV